VKRGEIWWTSLGDPIGSGSGPGYKNPVVVISSDDFNSSKISTLIVAIITLNPNLSEAPGNFELARRALACLKNR